MKLIQLTISILITLASAVSAEACTSMVVSGRASLSGRPMLWKHRDTSQASSFVERTAATDSTMAYVALYNAGDSTLSEAWTGMNSSGFGIMNTASYNLAPDTARYKDREGEVMAAALRRCSTVDDFERLLGEMKSPRGVQANFGVIDAHGGAAYFEVSDNGMTRFNADDDPSGCLIRTNFSVSGETDGGYGYIRYDNAAHILGDAIASGTLTPEHFTEKASRSFYHSIIGHDVAADTCRWAVDQDFIPRYTSTASIVIEGVNTETTADRAVMWTALGYPPCAIVQPVTVDSVPQGLRPTLPGFRSIDCEEALTRKALAFPIKRGNGNHYIDMSYVRRCSEKCKQKSLENYHRLRCNNMGNILLFELFYNNYKKMHININEK